MWDVILLFEAQKKMLKFKSGQKCQKNEKQPKKYSAIVWGILACTKVFHTSNKTSHLADLVVMRTFWNIHIGPRNKQTKLCH